MSDFKEFQSKTFDEAIQSACDYFNCERSKLEIEILEDAKTGLFGIIGARKARIAARRALPLQVTKKQVKKPSQEKTQAPVVNTVPVQKETEKTLLTPKQQEKTQGPKERAHTKEELPKKHVNEEKKEKIHAKQSTHSHIHFEKAERSYPSVEKTPFTELDQELLLSTSKNVVESLVKHIDDTAEVEVSTQGERLCLTVSTDDSGLLIGREGQTLASIEYIAARIITKQLNVHVRIQIEIGDYRSRQDAKLQEFALVLAERARVSGKSSSTRPLSAYQRRIVHLALQDMQDIQTRSIGDGSLKRVIISRARHYQ